MSTRKSPDIGPEDCLGEIIKGLLETVRNSGLPVVDDEAEDVFRDELQGRSGRIIRRRLAFSALL